MWGNTMNSNNSRTEAEILTSTHTQSHTHTQAFTLSVCLYQRVSVSRSLRVLEMSRCWSGLRSCECVCDAVNLCVCVQDMRFLWTCWLCNSQRQALHKRPPSSDQPQRRWPVCLWESNFLSECDWDCVCVCVKQVIPLCAAASSGTSGCI